MKIVQILMTENNIKWQGCILGLGDDGILYELLPDQSGWSVVTYSIVKG